MEIRRHNERLDSMEHEFCELLDGIMNMLTCDGGAIEQHKEKYGLDDTYELVHEFHKVYKAVKKAIHDTADRDEFYALWSAMNITDRLTTAELKLKKERDRCAVEDLEDMSA